MDVLSEERQKILYTSQNEWFEMRDKEFAFIDQSFNEETGDSTENFPVTAHMK
jgi:uncharacterized protein YecT (DUF1311 family)